MKDFTHLLHGPQALLISILNISKNLSLDQPNPFLNMNRSNVNGSHEKEGVGVIDAVDWYDGRAAMRVGIRWDI